jgi:hypothetical protein
MQSTIQSASSQKRLTLEVGRHIVGNPAQLLEAVFGDSLQPQTWSFARSSPEEAERNAC